MDRVIEVRGLTKRFGAVLAVDDLSFTVAPGAVTGFLGANGAGRSTTMRMVLGLDAPTAGTAIVAGRRYRDLRRPAREVSALLDPRCAHPGRTARAHLLRMADLAGVGRGRVDEVLELAGAHLRVMADGAPGAPAEGRTAAVAGIVAGGQAAGVFRAGDPRVLSLIVSGALDAAVAQWLADPAVDIGAAGAELERSVRAVLSPA